MKRTYHILIDRHVSFYGIESITYTAQVREGAVVLDSKVCDSRMEADTWIGNKHTRHLIATMQEVAK